MSTPTNLNYQYFKVAIIISLAIGLAMLGLSFYIGKDQFFLLLNNDMGLPADFFFNYFTYVGDGLLWVVWLIAFLATKRKNLLPLLLSAVAFTTLFTQICKQVILPYEARPLEAISDQSLVHYVKGVTVHSINSFPSGHTATAFTFVLLISLLVKRKYLMTLSFTAAILVGYSRIYLGQHFPLDVGAGIMVAICSVSLSVLVQQWFNKRRMIR